MDREENGNPRLGVYDKRVLFAGLMAKVERLFYLNKFPVDLEDYALSLELPEVEKAWRVLKKDADPSTLSPSSNIHVQISGENFLLSAYDGTQGHNNNTKMLFMSQGNAKPTLQTGNRFYGRASEWAKRQVKLEAQMLRTIKVIKCIVNSCNTVGQYQRVSPELIGFLPDKYAIALGQMTKKSPYPAIDVETSQIDAAMSTLAYAALQPPHHDEESFIRHPTSYGGDPTYRITQFPRTQTYESNNLRRSGI
jgi:hypothetical protein